MALERGRRRARRARRATSRRRAPRAGRGGRASGRSAGSRRARRGGRRRGRRGARRSRWRSSAWTNSRSRSAAGGWLIAERTSATSAPPVRSSSQTSSTRRRKRSPKSSMLPVIEHVGHQCRHRLRHLEGGGEQPVLGAEVVGHERDVHARVGGDVAHADAVVALRREALAGRGEDRVARCARPGPAPALDFSHG